MIGWGPKRAALIVEGHGDVEAVPALVQRVAAAEGANVFALKPPIRAGGVSSLRRQGELERHLALAASRPEADFVLVVLDCDALCPVELFEEFGPRALPCFEKYKKEIRFCFVKCEFESWFLADHVSIRLKSDGYWKYDDNFDSYLEIIGAKERLTRSMVGRVYKETRDQAAFARRIDVPGLKAGDRSFRKFVKCVIA